jgi:hypothetical protein
MGILLFRGSEADVYLQSDIYDPDVHGLPQDAPEGLVVPAIGSIVIVGDTGNRTLWVVDSVEDIELEGETVKKTHLVPANIIENGITTTRLVSYGNDTLMLYYDDRAEYTRCIPDSKFVCIGGNAAEYRLVKDVGGEITVISLKLDNDGNVEGDRIPIVDSAIPGIRVLTSCHTASDLDDGDLITIQIFDSTGVMTTTAIMTCKRSTILNDLLASTNPIVEFGASANQIDGANFVVYLGQNPEDLTIWPEIVYADGQRELVTVDGVRTFIYGLEDVNSNSVGLQFPILVKHFLAEDVPTTIALGEGVRYLQVEKNILVVPRVYASFSKIGIAPIFNPGTGEWSLVFLAYKRSRDTFAIINPNTITWVGPSFDGTAIGVQQNVTIQIPYINQAGNTVYFNQSFTIKVNGIAAAEPFLVADDENTDFVYGEESSQHKRPTVQYDATRETYFIPTSRHSTMQKFLDDFYFRASPPFLEETEVVAPTPTHFIFRNPTNGQVLTPLPVAVSQYDQEMSLATTGGPNQYFNQQLIVEFLYYNGISYDILFGMSVAPVSEGVYNV